ncbi:EamA family transporter [Patescibacteria group bacterium]|nr:EamA family transporter [Patescibacteria group bacterium]
MPKYLLFALGAMILYSIAPILHKKIPNVNSVTILFVYSLIGVVIFGGMLLFHLGGKVDMQGLKYAVIVGVIINLAFLLYVASIRLSGDETSKAVLLRGFGAVFAIFFTLIFFSEKITLIKIASLVLGSAAIVLALF